MFRCSSAYVFRRYNIAAVEDMRQASPQLDTLLNERAGSTTNHSVLEWLDSL